MTDSKDANASEPKTTVTPAIAALFDAERELRRQREKLEQIDPAVLAPALNSALAEARGLAEADERALRLASLAPLFGGIGGEASIDALIDILASEEPEARYAAGIELEELAFDRFKEVALGVERALGRLETGSPALAELPYVLREVPEPGMARLLFQFLEHRDPGAVASAIEVLADLGDPAAATRIARLTADPRLVPPSDGEDDPEAAEVTVGELAREALALLGEPEPPRAPQPRGGERRSGRK